MSDGRRTAPISVSSSRLPVEGSDGLKLQIVSVDPDGSNRHVIADAGDCYCLGWWPPGFTWSPDGTQIAYVTLGYAPDGRIHDNNRPLDPGLYVANVDGTSRRLVYGDTILGSPAWQPVP